ncbi:MAG: hypothetical protein QOF51_2631 [Chloroflexota bacterium]|jgi:hypothetical protein|nr:hypothetical protein [Chloroflexota bacterium]
MNPSPATKLAPIDESTQSAGRAALWTMIGILVAFKIATTAVILIVAPGARDVVIAFFIAFHWPLLLAAAVFGFAPLLFWLRLVKVRAKRAKLQAAEWNVA